MARINIPVQHRQVLIDLAQLDDAAASRLIESLGAQAPTARRAEVVTTLEEGLADTAIEAETLTQALFGMTTVATRQHLSRPDVAESVSASPDLGLGLIEQSQLERRLTALLDSPSIRLLGKVTDVANEQSHVFQSARLLTDVRPIFGDEVGEPLAAVVVHSLKIDYVRADGHPDSFYAALEESDLDDLAAAVDRARSKSASVKALLSRAGLTSMNTEGE